MFDFGLVIRIWPGDEASGSSKDSLSMDNEHVVNVDEESSSLLLLQRAGINSLQLRGGCYKKLELWILEQLPIFCLMLLMQQQETLPQNLGYL